MYLGIPKYGTTPVEHLITKKIKVMFKLDPGLQYLGRSMAAAHMSFLG